MATCTIFPGFYNHAERRVPLGSNNPQDVSLATLSIKIVTENIQRVSHAKFLGIIIDETLNWGSHIDYVAKKIASGSYAINTVKKYLSVRNLKSLYYSFVHSYILYGAMIWSSANKHKKYIECKIGQSEIYLMLDSMPHQPLSINN